MQQVLVTGGAGFIGSHTVDLLLAKGCRVVVLDNFVTGNRRNLPDHHPQLDIIEGDILDYPTLQKAISGCDAVLHLAALPSVQESIQDPISTLQVNTMGFLQVLQVIRALGQSIRVVYASSAAIYGGVLELPCRDDLDLSFATLSPYALEKANNERYADLFARLFGVQSLGLRYFNVYGPRQNPNSVYSGVITKFVEHYKKNEPVTVFGDGQQSRDFIHVSDIAMANWLALQSDYVGALNIATGVPETLGNLIRYIEATGDHALKVSYAPARPGDILQSYATTANAAKHLHFHYQTELAHGIRSLLE